MGRSGWSYVGELTKLCDRWDKGNEREEFKDVSYISGLHSSEVVIE